VLGDNSTGKTTVLRSIAIGLNDESSAAGLVRELTGSFVQQGKRQGRIYCEVYDQKSRWTIVTTIRTVKGTGDLIAQAVFNQPLDWVLRRRQRPFRNEKRFPWNRLFIVGYGSGRNAEELDEFDEYRTVDAVYTLFRYDQPLQSPELAWRRALARARRAHNEKDVAKSIEKLLRRVLMLEDKTDSIHLNDRIVVTKHHRSTPLADTSDGYKSTTTWMLDLMSWHLLFSPRARADSLRGIVLLDEIEQHLHPRWQRYIVSRLRRSFPQIQFIATTHSSLCAAGSADLSDEECALYRMVFSVRDRSIVAEDIALPWGLKADQILTSEAFGLTETRNPMLGDKVNEFRDLVRKEKRTGDEQRRLNQLRRVIRQVPSSAQFEDERRLRADLWQLANDLERRNQQGKQNDPAKTEA
jgi:hypothetical protein